MDANIKGKEYDLSKPIDISLPITSDTLNPIAWYLDSPRIEAVRMGEWVGSVASGASTNFNNIYFNPHGHGTHTECLGHITRDFYNVNEVLKHFLFEARLLTITPSSIAGDLVITMADLKKTLSSEDITEALIIRTLPNDDSKKSRKYSNTNPPYIAADALAYLRDSGVKHLLLDLPSVDKEKDEGKLEGHKAFWNVKNVNQLNEDARMDATITEMIFVGNDILDGHYLLNLQIASFHNDASPSKPILYPLK